MPDRHLLPLYRTLLLPASLWFTVVLTGCGGAPTYPIEGTVIFDDTGAPATELAGYVITLESVDGQVSASGVVEPDGTFEVSTYENGDGAVPGRHRVALNAPLSHELIEGPGATEPIPPIPGKYGSPATSGLEITVESSGQEIVLSLGRPGT